MSVTRNLIYDQQSSKEKEQELSKNPHTFFNISTGAQEIIAKEPDPTPSIVIDAQGRTAMTFGGYVLDIG